MATDTTENTPAVHHADTLARELSVLELICSTLDDDELAGSMYDLTSGSDDLEEIRVEYLAQADPEGTEGQQLSREAVDWIAEHAHELAAWDGRAAHVWVENALEVVHHGHRSLPGDDWFVDRIQILLTIGGPNTCIWIAADDDGMVEVDISWGQDREVRRLWLPYASVALLDATLIDQ